MLSAKGAAIGESANDGNGNTCFFLGRNLWVRENGGDILLADATGEFIIVGEAVDEPVMEGELLEGTTTTKEYERWAFKLMTEAVIECSGDIVYAARCALTPSMETHVTDSKNRHWIANKDYWDIADPMPGAGNARLYAYMCQGHHHCEVVFAVDGPDIFVVHEDFSWSELGEQQVKGTKWESVLSYLSAETGEVVECDEEA
jgi:hypothetical protein